MLQFETVLTFVPIAGAVISNCSVADSCLQAQTRKTVRAQATVGGSFFFLHIYSVALLTGTWRQFLAFYTARGSKHLRRCCLWLGSLSDNRIWPNVLPAQIRPVWQPPDISLDPQVFTHLRIYYDQVLATNQNFWPKLYCLMSWKPKFLKYYFQLKKFHFHAKAKM